MVFHGDWGSDGYIYWTNQLIGGVIRTPENGGKNEPVTELDVAKQERTHRYAKLLPGDKALIFTVASGGIDSFDDARIDAFDLATKKRKPIVQADFPQVRPVLSAPHPAPPCRTQQLAKAISDRPTSRRSLR